MAKIDRRVQRTRELLQKALIELIGERKYDALTIEDIAHRANVGRTTFYLHYRSKDDSVQCRSPRNAGPNGGRRRCRPAGVAREHDAGGVQAAGHDPVRLA